MDAFVAHPQLSDYTHVLDPYGNALGVDVGRSCLYGRTALNRSRAYRYCRPAWAAPGTRPRRTRWLRRERRACARGSASLVRRAGVRLRGVRMRVLCEGPKEQGREARGTMKGGVGVKGRNTRM